MRIFETLVEDHRGILNLVQENAFKGDEPPHIRLDFVDELRQQLLPHCRAEEVVIYDRLKQGETTETSAHAASTEHYYIMRILKDLSGTDTSDGEWAARVNLLKDLLEKHLMDEEIRLMPQARALLSNREAEEIFDEYHLTKNKMSGSSFRCRFISAAKRTQYAVTRFIQDLDDYPNPRPF